MNIDRCCNWLRDHILVMDESEPDTYENLMESIVGVVESAMRDSEDSLCSGDTQKAVSTLKQAMRYRRGIGSDL